MRISRDKRLPDTIQLAPHEIQASIDGRKRELGALIQAALKVGSDLSAREAGRRAFAELVKIDRDLQPVQTLPMATTPQVIFSAPAKRRRMRVGA
ncbi:MAG: hypothetical protein HIU92_08905 [Proteobacteria bacterium]|nr:hypothetical protein [Pseudomonadota bacterium]